MNAQSEAPDNSVEWTLLGVAIGLVMCLTIAGIQGIFRQADAWDQLAGATAGMAAIVTRSAEGATVHFVMVDEVTMRSGKMMFSVRSENRLDKNALLLSLANGQAVELEIGSQQQMVFHGTVELLDYAHGSTRISVQLDKKEAVP